MIDSGIAETIGGVIVIHPVFSLQSKGRQTTLGSFDARADARDPEESLEEAIGLARAIKLDVLEADIVKINRVRPATLLGKGAVDDIAACVEELDPGVVIINGHLSPIQQRNLEKALKAKVIDRTGLILEIFGARARTAEGKLQVELAALSYQRSRLVRSWTHLERQRGGYGFLGGPGESQIEIDRRLIDQRVERIRSDLEQVKKRRSMQRRARERVPYPIVALVGYTNAGKSTLFNRIAGANVMAKDMLFATLDPTMRALELPSGRHAIFSDTVGFIADLPTMLIDAFRATLEEVEAADIILHVRDAAHRESREQRKDVHKVMKDLGIDIDKDERIIEVMNKIDCLDIEDRAALAARRGSDVPRIAVSALTGEGLHDLLDAIDARLIADRRHYSLSLPVADGRPRAWLHEYGEILREETEGDAMYIMVSLSPEDRARFERYFDISMKALMQKDNDGKENAH